METIRTPQSTTQIVAHFSTSPQIDAPQRLTEHTNAIIIIIIIIAVKRASSGHATQRRCRHSAPQFMNERCARLARILNALICIYYVYKRVEFYMCGEHNVKSFVRSTSTPSSLRIHVFSLSYHDDDVLQRSIIITRLYTRRSPRPTTKYVLIR